MKKDDIHSEALERFQKATDADATNRELALADLKFAFVPGEQWDAGQKKLRGNRPCYEFNKIRQHIKIVQGAQRQNRPQIKLRAVDSNTDPEFAEQMTGLIRNIESRSNAEWAYDTAFEFASTGGFGAWRVATEYSDDTAFEQEIVIKEIRNPFAVAFDPAATEWDCRDATYAFVSEMMPKAEFEDTYPDEDTTDWPSSAGDKLTNWLEEDAVRVAEYWCKKPTKKKILLLSTGEVVDFDKVKDVLDELAADGITVIREREVDTHKVEMYVVSGGGVLSGPHEWAGKFIPIVPCWGDRLNIEGEEKYSGMVRFSKDAQRSYNYERTSMMETVSLVPKAPYLLTKKMVEGFQEYWDKANTENYAYLPYNPDPAQPGGPKRERGPEIPAALMNLSQMSSDDIKSSTGQFDASLGARSNETSGKAIMARQHQGDLGTFSYVDNLARALKFTGEILVDLIPKVYDTERAVRVLGEDDTEDFVVLNQSVVDEQTGQVVIVHDLSKAKFDVTVDTGPSYATQRMETADAMLQLSQGNDVGAQVARYLAIKNLDVPGADPMLKALRKNLVAQGLLEPEEGEEPPQPPPPDPEKMAKAQKLAAEAEKLEFENQYQGQLAPHKLAAEIEEIEARVQKTVAQAVGEQIENLVRQGYIAVPPGTQQLNM